MLARREAGRIWSGESPGMERVNHPPLPSVAPLAERSSGENCFPVKASQGGVKRLFQEKCFTPIQGQLMWDFPVHLFWCIAPKGAESTWRTTILRLW